MLWTLDARTSPLYKGEEIITQSMQGTPDYLNNTILNNPFRVQVQSHQIVFTKNDSAALHVSTISPTIGVSETGSHLLDWDLEWISYATESHGASEFYFDVPTDQDINGTSFAGSLRGLSAEIALVPSGTEAILWYTTDSLVPGSHEGRDLLDWILVTEDSDLSEVTGYKVVIEDFVTGPPGQGLIKLSFENIGGESGDIFAAKGTSHLGNSDEWMTMPRASEIRLFAEDLGASEDSGSTEDGSTEDGSTEDGSTEDPGLTEDGSTENGSTEDAAPSTDDTDSTDDDVADLTGGDDPDGSDVEQGVGDTGSDSSEDGSDQVEVESTGPSQEKEEALADSGIGQSQAGSLALALSMAMFGGLFYYVATRRKAAK